MRICAYNDERGKESSGGVLACNATQCNGRRNGLV